MSGEVEETAIPWLPPEALMIRTEFVATSNSQAKVNVAAEANAVMRVRVPKLLVEKILWHYKVENVTMVVGLAGIGLAFVNVWFLLLLLSFGAWWWSIQRRVDYQIRVNAYCIALDFLTNDVLGWGTAAPAAREIALTLRGEVLEGPHAHRWLDAFMPDWHVEREQLR